MIPNFYIENGCFTEHPFTNGCLGFQVKQWSFLFRPFIWWSTWSFQGVVPICSIQMLQILLLAEPRTWWFPTHFSCMSRCHGWTHHPIDSRIAILIKVDMNQVFGVSGFRIVERLQTSRKMGKHLYTRLYCQVYGGLTFLNRNSIFKHHEISVAVFAEYSHFMSFELSISFNQVIQAVTFLGWWVHVTLSRGEVPWPPTKKGMKFGHGWVITRNAV